MTPVETVYNAFLSKVLEDEWGYDTWSEEEIKRDLSLILAAALPNFKFPKVSLDIVTNENEEECFEGDLNNSEIQILATYMKCEWLNRNIMTWENIKPLYEERDFSQANLLDKLNVTLSYEKAQAKELESIYYRSINRKPFDYRSFASKVEK